MAGFLFVGATERHEAGAAVGMAPWSVFFCRQVLHPAILGNRHGSEMSCASMTLPMRYHRPPGFGAARSRTYQVLGCQ